MTGICKYCGQTMSVNSDIQDDGEANEYAARNCNCPGGMNYRAERRAEEERKAALARAEKQIDELLGPGASGYGFISVEEDIRTLLYEAAVLIYDENMKDLTVNLDCIKVKIKKSSKGKLQFLRSDVAAFQLEA